MKIYKQIIITMSNSDFTDRMCEIHAKANYIRSAYSPHSKKKVSLLQFLSGVFSNSDVKRISPSAFEITFKPDCGCCRSQLDLIRQHGFEIAVIHPPYFRVTFEKSGNFVYLDY